MKLLIYGRKIILIDVIRKYVEEKILKVEKFNDFIIKIDVILVVFKLKIGNVYVIEILVYLSGSILKVIVIELDLYVLIDKVVDIMESLLKKYKEKRSRVKV